MAQVTIEANLANLLYYAGSLYRNPADALKEYISNAIDAFREEALHEQEKLIVRYELKRNEIVISYNAPGMTEREWKDTLKRVADSLKHTNGNSYIGMRGIGNFSYIQAGKAAEFLHKKNSSAPTVKVGLCESSTKAEVRNALKREELPNRGVRVRIYDLKVSDPTSPKSPVAIQRLARHFAEKFDAYLRSGLLSIIIASGKQMLEVKPLEIKLPPVGEDYRLIYAYGPNGATYAIRCTFWFDPSGKGSVKIRHAGVPIVDNMHELPQTDLEASVFASGNVFGYFDADFLEPLPTRNGFEEGPAWDAFVTAIQRLAPAILAEVDMQKEEGKIGQARKIYEQAIKLARELFASPEFRDLDWFASGQKISQGSRTGQRHAPTKKRTPPDGSRSNNPSETPGGKRIAFQIEPFPEGPLLHSMAIIGQNVVLRINALNPDYIHTQKETEKDQTYYFARLISKELLAYNDQTGFSDESLEKSLSAEFMLRRQLKT